MGTEDLEGAGFWQALWQGPMALYRIRFGKGVLGRLTTNLIATESVFGALGAISLIRGYVWVGVGCMAVCVVIYWLN